MSKILALCVLSTIFGEAGGESPIGQQAVAHVVLNRAKSQHRDACNVVHQRGQFRPRRPPKSFRVTVKSADPTEGSTYFRNYGGPWKGRKFVKKIGNHYFYRDAYV